MPNIPVNPAVASSYAGRHSDDILDRHLSSPEYSSPQTARDHTTPHANSNYAKDERGSEAEGPPSSFTLMKVSSDLGIEAILQWPVFRDRLSHLSDNTLMEDLGEPPNPHDWGSPSTVEPTIQDGAVRFDSDTMDRLVENFLVDNFPSNPILDPSSLRRDAHQLAESGLRWDGKSCLVVSPTKHHMVEGLAVK